MTDELKKHLEKISEEDAKEIIDGNHEIKEWVESQKKRNNSQDTHRNTGLTNSFARKKNE